VARILVVDDDDKVRDFIRMVLEQAGHQVLEAGDGAEALRVFHEQPSDLVVCDLFMPLKDGFETIRELRQDFPQVKVLALSGDTLWVSLDLTHADWYLRANQFLPKPFDRPTLLDAVGQLLPDPGRAAVPSA
jgi:CheY-like chemotaxis protein